MWKLDFRTLRFGFGGKLDLRIIFEKVNASFDEEKIRTVVVKRYREALLERLRLCYNDPKKAFTGCNSLDKNPLFIDKMHTEKVPDKVKTVILEKVYTQRQEVNKDLNIDKVVDKRIKTLLQERLNQYGGDKQKAFSTKPNQARCGLVLDLGANRTRWIFG